MPRFLVTRQRRRVTFQTKVIEVEAEDETMAEVAAFDLDAANWKSGETYYDKQEVIEIVQKEENP